MWLIASLFSLNLPLSISWHLYSVQEAETMHAPPGFSSFFHFLHAEHLPNQDQFRHYFAMTCAFNLNQKAI